MDPCITLTQMSLGMDKVADDIIISYTVVVFALYRLDFEAQALFVALLAMGPHSATKSYVPL